MLDQAESWVLGVISGADYPGIHACCIFLIKNTTVGDGDGKAKTGKRIMRSTIFDLYSMKSIFLILRTFQQKQTVGGYIYLMNVNMYVN